MRIQTWLKANTASLRGKRVAVCGSTGGLGQALCHHLATGPGQLSFRKGDTLRVLGPAGADWLRCSRGPDTGLVPLAYVTLTPTPSPSPGSSQN